MSRDSCYFSSLAAFQTHFANFRLSGVSFGRFASLWRCALFDRFQILDFLMGLRVFVHSGMCEWLRRKLSIFRLLDLSSIFLISVSNFRVWVCLVSGFLGFHKHGCISDAFRTFWNFLAFLFANLRHSGASQNLRLRSQILNFLIGLRVFVHSGMCEWLRRKLTIFRLLYLVAICLISDSNFRLWVFFVSGFVKFHKHGSISDAFRNF